MYTRSLLISNITIFGSYKNKLIIFKNYKYNFKTKLFPTNYIKLHCKLIF